MIPVRYTSDHLRDYSKGLRKCETLEDLKQFAELWIPFAVDGYNVAIGMNQFDFVDFRAGLLKESKGKYQGDAFAERYSPLILPEVLFNVAAVAQQFKVPWGTAFIQLQGQGWIVKQADGYYIWIDKEITPHD